MNILKLNALLSLKIIIIIAIILCGIQAGFSQTATIDSTFTHLKENPKTLYAFLMQMPKGGDLHDHFDGSVPFDTLIQLAQKGEYCVDPETFILSRNTGSCTKNTIQSFISNPKHLQQLHQAWSMDGLSPDDPERYDHFFNIFQKVALIYQDYTTQILVDMIRLAAAQHELYLEIIMLNPRQQNETIPAMPAGANLEEKKNLFLANPKVQQLIHQQVTVAKTHLEQAHKMLGCDANPRLPACQVTVKFQYFILRENTLNEVFGDALIGFAAAQQSDEIVGINMVQPEKGQHASDDFKQQMQYLNFLHQAYPSVNISLHAGELASTMIQGNPQRNHIQDSIYSGHAQRIGHGAALFSEDNYLDLINYMAKQSIAVEINLTSNQDTLSLTHLQHPFPFYLKHHVPVVLSTDDAGISETNLTQEFFKAVQQYHLDYATIRYINRNALTYSFLPGKSIWLDAYRQIPVSSCRHLSSIACHNFIEKSQKAQLQWKLEKKLAAFEAQWIATHAPDAITPH